MTGRSRPPVHLHPASLLLVWIGGATGSMLRWLVGRWVPAVARVPAGTLLVNLAGAFALGLLLERLLRGGPDRGWRQRARLGLGTGLLGGFTTYSSLSLEVALLLRQGQLGVAAGYGLGSAVLGVLAAAAGVLLGGIRRRGTGS